MASIRLLGVAPLLIRLALGGLTIMLDFGACQFACLAAYYSVLVLTAGLRYCKVQGCTMETVQRHVVEGSFCCLRCWGSEGEGGREIKQGFVQCGSRRSLCFVDPSFLVQWAILLLLQ